METVDIKKLIEAAYSFLENKGTEEVDSSEENSKLKTSEIFPNYSFVTFDTLFEAVAAAVGISADAEEEKAALLAALRADTRFVNSKKVEKEIVTTSDGKEEVVVVPTEYWDINRQRKSMTDTAYDYLKNIQQEKIKNGVSIQNLEMAMNFQSLYDEVCKILNISPKEAIDKRGMFYTNLTLDSRFRNLIVDNRWDLSENHALDLKDDLNDAYTSDDDLLDSNMDTEELDESEKEELNIRDDSDEAAESESDQD